MFTAARERAGHVPPDFRHSRRLDAAGLCRRDFSPARREIVRIDARAVRQGFTNVCESRRIRIGISIAIQTKMENIHVHRKIQGNEVSAGNFNDWLRLIQSEYAEMPGLHLSKRQAQRLWNLDSHSCEVIFEALEASHFLKRMGNDSYVRADIEH